MNFDFETFKSYLPLVLILVFLVWRFGRFHKVKGLIPELLSQGGIIVDVRGTDEYRGACNPKSINIPLDQITARCKTLDKEKPVIVCCASGTRSMAAASILRQQGFKQVLNAGPWTNTVF